MLQPKNLVRLLVYGALIYAVIVVGVPAYKNRGAFNGFDVSTSSALKNPFFHKRIRIRNIIFSHIAGLARQSSNKSSAI